MSYEDLPAPTGPPVVPATWGGPASPVPPPVPAHLLPPAPVPAETPASAWTPPPPGSWTPAQTPYQAYLPPTPRSAASPSNSKRLGRVVTGFLLIAVGLGISYATYDAASGGGTYLVAWGPVFAGIVRIWRGLFGTD